VTGATNAIKLGAASFSGVSTSSVLDAVSSSGGTTGNPSSSITTATASALIVTTLHRHSTTTATTNRTPLYNESAVSTLAAGSYQLATSTGVYSDTYTGSADYNWAMISAAFKPAVGGSASTTVSYLLTDHLEGTNVVTNASGSVVQTLDYYPYGAPRIKTGSDVSQREYIGEHYDESSGLNYLNARYYDGSRGGFISQDPVFWSLRQNLFDPQSLNSYGYANGNPIARSDPSGQQASFAPALQFGIPTFAFSILLSPVIPVTVGGVLAVGAAASWTLSGPFQNETTVRIGPYPRLENETGIEQIPYLMQHPIPVNGDAPTTPPNNNLPRWLKTLRNIVVGGTLGTIIYRAAKGALDPADPLSTDRTPIQPNNASTPSGSSSNQKAIMQTNSVGGAYYSPQTGPVLQPGQNQQDKYTFNGGVNKYGESYNQLFPR
jgi:RHS repeat-associated protein